MVRRRIWLVTLALFGALVLGGCASESADDPWPAPRALGSQYRSYRPPAEPGLEPPGPMVPLGDSLSLEEAIALALARHPGLVAAGWQIRAGEARADQEGASPNPEARLRYSDFGGTGRFSGTDDSEQELRITQDVELADKASKRRRVAQLEARLFGWDYEARRLDVIAEVSREFVVAAAATRRAEITREAHETLARVLSSLARAEGVSPIEAARRRLQQTESRIAADRAARAVEAARQNLAAAWGARTANLPPLAPLPQEAPELPSLGSLLAKVDLAPEVARWETDASLRQAAEKLAEADRVPDLEFLGEVRREEESGDHGFSLGVSVDIPIFDRNSAAVREARFLRLKAAHEQALAAEQARAVLRQAHAAAADARAELLALQELIPAAESAFEAAEDAFSRGGIPYQEYLRAHRTLSDARLAVVDAREAYRLAVVDIERAMAAPLHP